jgi:cyclopentanol dehydrogenase
MLLPGRVAIITGGARGMGRAIAHRYSSEGCSIVIADILDTEANRTVADIRSNGGCAIYVKCDVTSSSQVENVVSQTIEMFGKVDILVNCAGIGTKPTPLEETTEEDWDRVMAVNCKGTFFCIQAVAPHMKQRNYGKIINIVSVAAFDYGGINFHYFASKAAQASVARTAAVALAPFNVCVNSIHPGMVLTDMSAIFSGPGVKDVVAHQTEMARSNVPFQRLGTPEDIASAALFLASEESSYITGDSICVSGGSGLFKLGPPI